MAVCRFNTQALLKWFINCVISLSVVSLCCATVFPNTLVAETLITEKQRFTLQKFTTTSGAILPEVEIGWESYGTLNAKKSNVILITHYFGGTSHAAGKYAETDKRAGYWDAIIGSGKAIDTNKFYVISSDSLSNINVKDPKVFSTGPSSINPATGKPYGSDFPIITIRDIINVQHALLKSLSIDKLHAVAGASMGSHQALEWASAFPDMVARVISVIGVGETDSHALADFEISAQSIKKDPLWNKGHYYGKQEPAEGLAAAMLPLILHAHHGVILDQRHKEIMNKDLAPWQSINASFAVSTWLENVSRLRTMNADANHLLYLLRSVQLFRIGHKQSLELGIATIKAKALLLPAKNDLMYPTYNMKKVYDIMKDQGINVIYEEIDGPWGHLDGVFNISQKSELIRKFLED